MFRGFVRARFAGPAAKAEFFTMRGFLRAQLAA